MDDEVRQMQRRLDDPPGITLDRKIPLWGIVTVALALVAQGVLLWSGSREAAIEQKHMSNRVAELTLEVKAMATQMTTKSEQDVTQNGELRDLQRRVAELERTRGR